MESNKYLYALAGIGMMMLRNNGIFVFIPMMLSIIILIKHVRMKVLLTSLVMIVISITPDIVIKETLDLPQLFQERVGIPLQQYSRTVAVGAPLTKAEENYTIRMMMPEQIKTWYDPFTADLIKWNSNFDFITSITTRMNSGKLGNH